MMAKNHSVIRFDDMKIGNLVYYNGQVVRVKDINISEIEAVFSVCVENSNFCAYVNNNLSSIPITKLSYLTRHFNHDYRGDFKLEFNKDGSMDLLCPIIHSFFRIRWIHELQNIYKHLTGKAIKFYV